MSNLKIPATLHPSNYHRIINCWFPCNRIEFDDLKGISHWRCTLYPENLAPTYTSGSNRNMNRHVDDTHGINKANPIGAVIMPADAILHMAFA